MSFIVSKATAKRNAVLLVVAWLLMLGPGSVLAALVGETASYRAHGTAPFEYAIDLSAYSNLRLSFEYDASTLDFGPPQDSFSYGYRSGGNEYLLGTVLGLAGSTTDESGNVDVALPDSAAASDLSIFVIVTANSAASSDKVELRNIRITGDLKPVELPDVCLNLDGVQENVPAGYVLGENGVCTVSVPDPDPETDPVDVCPNLEGLQEAVPAGYVATDDECVVVTEEPPATDLCLNLDGIQAVVPSGLVRSEAGECKALTVVNPPVKPPHTGSGGKPKQCPRGFSKWIDRFPGGFVWRADDVYQAVILVGGPVSRHANRDRAHHVYIPGPTEIGDRYYRRFHRIELICVR